MLLTLFAVTLAGNPSAMPGGGRSLSHALGEATAHIGAGGFVAAKIENGSIHYQEEGAPAPKRDIPPEKVIFEIGSITKVFTALLLAQAVIEHKAALSDPITRYLPPDVAASPGLAGITLEQLATHTSGLPPIPNNMNPHRLDPGDAYAAYTREDLYAFLRSYHPMRPSPRPWSYSNLGVGLLGFLLTKIYGRPYAEIVASKITVPFGMPDTGIDLDDEQRRRFAIPHIGPREVNHWSIATIPGMGALRSTAADLARFTQVLMAPRDNPLRAAWDLMRQPRHDIQNSKEMQIGLIVTIETREGEIVYSHAGATGGFRSYLEWSPPRGRALVILENNLSIDPVPLVTALHPLAPWVRADYPTRPEVTLPPAQAADFVGKYEINDVDGFTIDSNADGRLHMSRTGQASVTLCYAGADCFFYRNAAAEIRFSRGSAGEMTSLALYRNGIPHPLIATRSERRADGDIVP